MATKKTTKKTTTKTEETKAAAVGSEDLAGTAEQPTETRSEDDTNPIPSDDRGFPLPTEEQAARRAGPK